jgi:hypothetical protein
MDVFELPRGERAPDDSDRAVINVLRNGKAGFTIVWQAGSVQAHVIHGNELPTEADAVDAALREARARNIKFLYIERS